MEEGAAREDERKMRDNMDRLWKEGRSGAFRTIREEDESAQIKIPGTMGHEGTAAVPDNHENKCDGGTNIHLLQRSTKTVFPLFTYEAISSK